MRGAENRLSGKAEKNIQISKAVTPNQSGSRLFAVLLHEKMRGKVPS